MANAFQLTVNNEGIGTLVFDLPNEKVNKFNIPILEELEQIVDGLAKRSDIKALVLLSGKEDIFIAGADLHTFERVFQEPSLLDQIISLGHRVFDKISNLPFPTIAYINGACLGGGTECALACTYRIASDSPKTQIGLPEVSLGIISGWGGTQRLPRLVGMLEGMDIILPGKSVKATKAYKIHLVDALTAHEFKDAKIKEFISAILSSSGKKKILEKRKLTGMRHWLLEANPLGRAFLFNKAEKGILQKTKGHYPAPLLALKVLRETASVPLKKGLEMEIKAVTEEMPKNAAIANHLISLFFVQEALKKDTGVPAGIKPLPVKNVAVIGAGVMGSGIAWLLTDRDFTVRMKDIDMTVIGKGYGTIKSIYDDYVKRKKLKPNEASLKLQKLSTTTDLTGFQRADFIIEAAVENLDLKKKIFEELESKISDRAIIASNTSSLSITEMAKFLKHPERFVGVHFFNPVPRMPLVEVVKGAATSDETLATAVDLCKKLGKTPMVVGDCRGFLVNRIFTTSANEVFRLFEEGVAHEKLDHMMLNFGFPMPPFVLADEVGIDVMYKVNHVLEEAYGSRMQSPKVIDAMYEKKLFGKKVKKGFYIYKGKDKSFNPEVYKLMNYKAPNNESMSQMEMSDRVMLLMINEAARCLQEKIVSRPDYLDMALIMGVGFPPFRGGLLRYADSLGINYIVDHLKAFEQKYGSRFAPCDRLLEMQKNGESFY